MPPALNQMIVWVSHSTAQQNATASQGLGKAILSSYSSWCLEMSLTVPAPPDIDPDLKVNICFCSVKLSSFTKALMNKIYFTNWGTFLFILKEEHFMARAQRTALRPLLDIFVSQWLLYDTWALRIAVSASTFTRLRCPSFLLGFEFLPLPQTEKPHPLGVQLLDSHL